MCAGSAVSAPINGGARDGAGRKSLGLSTAERKQRTKDLTPAKVPVPKELKKRCLDMLKGGDPTVVVKDNAFAKLATKLLERELQENADPARAGREARPQRHSTGGSGRA